MPIVEVSCAVVRAPLREPFVTSKRRTDHLESLVVRLADEDGRHGFGEAPPIWRRGVGKTLAEPRACCEGPLRDVVLGRDPDDVNALGREIAAAADGNFGAKAAVDVALHDLAARRRGVPLVRFLGGTASSVPTDVTLSAGTADALAEAAKARVSEGFGVLKAKVGADAAGDVARVRAIREAVGPDVVIRLDANQGWTPTEAAGLGVELIEQPVAPQATDRSCVGTASAYGLPLLPRRPVQLAVRERDRAHSDRVRGAGPVALGGRARTRAGRAERPDYRSDAVQRCDRRPVSPPRSRWWSPTACAS